MHALGYPVELEVSERHDESLNLDRYTEQQDRERDLAKREDDVEVKKRSVQRDMDAIERDREQAAKELEQAKADREAAQGVLENAEEQARAVAERVLKEAREKAEQEAEQTMALPKRKQTSCSNEPKRLRGPRRARLQPQLAAKQRRSHVKPTRPVSRLSATTRRSAAKHEMRPRASATRPHATLQ